MIAINATNSSKHYQRKWRYIEIRWKTFKSVLEKVALVMVTGNVFQTLIDLKKKLLAILLVPQKGFNSVGPVERVQLRLKRISVL